MSARNYNYSLRDNAEERSSQPLYVYVLQVLTFPEKNFIYLSEVIPLYLLN